MNIKIILYIMIAQKILKTVYKLKYLKIALYSPREINIGIKTKEIAIKYNILSDDNSSHLPSIRQIEKMEITDSRTSTVKTINCLK